MIIEKTSGSLLESNVDALVNTVNCVGVMGKGLALQFKKAYPENFKAYEKACTHHQLVLGKMHVFETHAVNPRYIINFPTKGHWKAKSRLIDIEKGLAALKQEIIKLNIKSIAIPPLGCGNGGLDWKVVLPLIENSLMDLVDVEIFIYSPQEHKGPRYIEVKSETPKMTKTRALFILLIKDYKEPDYALTSIEIQKLAYFMYRTGENLNLNFVKHLYGPYSPKIRHVLNDMEGHYLLGCGDNADRAEIKIKPGVEVTAYEFLKNDSSSLERLNLIRQLIEGYETPYGMELLSSIDWLAAQEEARSLDDVYKGLKEWNTRKAQFKPKHVESGWKHLKALNWI
ncbi:MAG: macro domain-containing protein [Gammaproteobacteria bacterium]|jgi:O-acetyl-ADP-ribose deacetylase (regulator of RNase III)|nr:macro domain-containing protein [Gammaproteobacteria bacterium]